MEATTGLRTKGAETFNLDGPTLFQAVEDDLGDLFGVEARIGKGH